ncbi:unnamed protein product [Caenorhabditis bovis]|uniref:CCHC-type domain-containing protein n=1 Tax=Caenorhabditis bovis TaxID=2654633 RepID=A0A8S1FB73_9PELO|nr:unnamed protein product [Caenorhabditis bovis]
MSRTQSLTDLSTFHLATSRVFPRLADNTAIKGAQANFGTLASTTSKLPISCLFCGKRGHIAAQCWAKKRQYARVDPVANHQLPHNGITGGRRAFQSSAYMHERPNVQSLLPAEANTTNTVAQLRLILRNDQLARAYQPRINTIRPCRPDAAILRLQYILVPSWFSRIILSFSFKN